MSIPLEELLVLALLLLGVVGVYYALKLHYVFAFGLVQKTAISEEKKQKIEKIKSYVFTFLKVLLAVGLVSMFVFGAKVLMDGLSLKTIVIDLWQMIPEGFWLSLFWTLIRIALLILVVRYILKKIYIFLEREQEKTISKKRYNTQNVRLVYLRIHNTIKYTFVLGVIYRIVHFFPFLLEVSYVFLLALILFFIVALGITLKEVILMKASQRSIIRK
ncbi:MAG: hypothetical protein Q9M39_10365 [Sulfurovum sp.]|nr:hypothetical protein [Sulfurovum sp.]